MLPVVLIAGSSLAAWQILQGEPAASAVVVCDGQKANDFKCWQQRFEAMVENDSPKVALADAEAAYKTVGYVKTNCHQLAHVIGRAGAAKYGDVSRAYLQGDDFCWSGYYHGVIEAVAKKIGTEGILADINGICKTLRQQREYSFDHYNCVHGLGHGLMAVMNNNLFTALKGCDKLDSSWQQESCFSGVFMENVMSEFNPGTRSDYLKADDPLYPCTAVESRYKQQCYLMQTSHALVVVNRDYNKVFELCSTVGAPFSQTCYESLGRDISGNSSSDITFTNQWCMQGPSEEARRHCIIGAVKDFISYFHDDRQGSELCASLNSASIKQTCIDTAKTYYETF